MYILNLLNNFRKKSYKVCVGQVFFFFSQVLINLITQEQECFIPFITCHQFYFEITSFCHEKKSRFCHIYIYASIHNITKICNSVVFYQKVVYGFMRKAVSQR